MKYLVANWKSHMRQSEADKWMATFASFDQKSLSSELRIIICPSFPLIPLVQKHAQKLSISIGAQDISSYPSGSHTGQVSSDNLSGLVEYVLVGHSESRKITGDNNLTIESKIQQAKQSGIQPILCVSDQSQIFGGCDFVCFEPIGSIGNGQPDEISDVSSFKKNFDTPPKNFFYGGSVSQNNVGNYLNNDLVNGFLVGTNSLDPHTFYEIACQL